MSIMAKRHLQNNHDIIFSIQFFIKWIFETEESQKDEY